MSYDVSAVRAHFPALAEGAAHFDGPGGSQVPDVVGAAVAGVLTAAVANRGTVTAAERRAEECVTGFRSAMADLLGATPRGIVHGRSMTALTYDVSRALAATWAPGDEVVVTRLDHDANIRPWVQAATRAGAEVRWVDVDPADGELTADALVAVLSERTRLVAFTAGSNLIGTMPDIPALTAAVHAAGALAYVDGVHATAHVPVDLQALGADFYVCSPYKLMGPHCGVLAADPALLDTLHPDKLLPATDEVPERLELGTLPYEVLAGCTAMVDFVASLGALTGAAPPAPGATRRERVVASMAAVEEYEDGLRERIEAGLGGIPGLTLYSRAARRTPTLLVTSDRVDAQTLRLRLATDGVNAPAGSFYAIEPSRRLGLGDAGGLRIGLAPYSDAEDVDRLLRSLARAARS
ncbi:MAG: cysteine desulfurase-like protein [Candidatus Lutibacillus vidarii]|mgnify:FL=1|nr:cysteine desulfurase-like protein [Candidatus Lutibacillus vidarii]HON73533.1 cysteine desulfurase-like protein [Dermatophilaceae bacterium]